MKKRNKINLYDKKDDTIVLLGGSFNPIHNGHIAMAEAAHSEYGHDIVLLPNKSTYYKDNSNFTSDEYRIDMLELVNDEYSYIYYSDIEIIRGGITHTVDTIRELKNEYGYKTIYFIIGGDSLEWIDKWVDADELLDNVIFLTAVRGETDKEKSRSIIDRIKNEHPLSDIRLLNMKENPVSSSEIRDRLKNGLSIEGMVPMSVESYIIKNKLYV